METQHLTFRSIILVSLGSPALLLWISGYYAWESWHSYSILRTTIPTATWWLATTTSTAILSAYRPPLFIPERQIHIGSCRGR